MLVHLNGEEYFTVKISSLRMWDDKEEIARAKAEAKAAGFNPSTIQRMTEHNECFYTFSK